MSRALNYLIAIGSILITLGVSAGEVGTLYIKNNCSSALNVWVDEQYQGYVPAGTTRHVVREGFVTFASGRNGKKVEESHGGWVSKGAISVRGQSKAKKNVLASAISLNGDPEKKAYVWFGDGADAGAPLTDRDAEESKQINKGNAKPLEPQGELRAATRDEAKVPKQFIGFWVDTDGLFATTIRPDGSVIKTSEREERQPPLFVGQAGAVRAAGIDGIGQVMESSDDSIIVRFASGTFQTLAVSRESLSTVSSGPDREHMEVLETPRPLSHKDGKSRFAEEFDKSIAESKAKVDH